MRVNRCARCREDRPVGTLGLSFIVREGRINKQMNGTISMCLTCASSVFDLAETVDESKPPGDVRTAQAPTEFEPEEEDEA